MAELHTAFKALGPTDWDTIPTSEIELDSYLVELFADAQRILDSVPIAAPDDSNTTTRARADTQNSATKASEILPSLERSAPPTSEHERLQKEWGKPMKLKQSENPLEMSVYKVSGKDGKGAWFARRSVHEGIGFSKFKKSLEQEFPQSMSEPGPPGTGNIRGIGGEEVVENIKVPNRGQIEVYRLSAQFPGPTTPRDFVTMLVTSNTAMKDNTTIHDVAIAPRHYMIISKPCNHPKTQPQSGFIRGYYESVEFIREVPRKLRASRSTVELKKLGHGTESPNLEKQMRLKHADQRSQTFQLGSDTETEKRPKSEHADTSSRRKRAVTVGSPVADSDGNDAEVYDPECNPVEWIMITRSDPGGSVPRFMVERGTPSSICADAVKFLDWACKNDFSDDSTTVDIRAPITQKPLEDRRQSFQSFRARSMVGVEEYEKEVDNEVQKAYSSTEAKKEASDTPSHGIWDSVAGAAASLRPYTPQAVLKHLPNSESTTNDIPSEAVSSRTAQAAVDEDNKSIKSTSSFASAEDHLSSSSSSSADVSIPSGHIAVDNEHNETISQTTTSEKKDNSKDLIKEHEKQIKALDARRQALTRKHAESLSKLEAANQKSQSASETAIAKSRAKHERDLKKHDEKYSRELAKLERKAEKERKKLDEKQKRAQDKDEKGRMLRERDEARAELDLAKKEVEELKGLVRELQGQNTKLVMKLGKAGLISGSDSELIADLEATTDSATASKSSPASSMKKGVPAPGSMKSEQSGLS